MDPITDDNSGTGYDLKNREVFSKLRGDASMSEALEYALFNNTGLGGPTGHGILDCAGSHFVGSRASTIAHFDRMVGPSAWIAAHVGITHTTSACLGLAALLLNDGAGVGASSRVYINSLGANSDSTQSVINISSLHTLIDASLSAKLASRALLEPAAFNAICQKYAARWGQYGWTVKATGGGRDVYHLREVAFATPDGQASRTYALKDSAPLNYVLRSPRPARPASASPATVGAASTSGAASTNSNHGLELLSLLMSSGVAPSPGVTVATAAAAPVVPLVNVTAIVQEVA
eukprot:6751454-Prymnesium_polylepis.1